MPCYVGKNTCHIKWKNQTEVEYIINDLPLGQMIYTCMHIHANIHIYVNPIKYVHMSQNYWWLLMKELEQILTLFYNLLKYSPISTWHTFII